MRGQLDRNAANKSGLLSVQRHLGKICLLPKQIFVSMEAIMSKPVLILLNMLGSQLFCNLSSTKLSMRLNDKYEL